MRNILLTTVAALFAVATAACTDTPSQPTIAEVEALVASAPEWTPSDITRGLQIDDAARQELEAAVGELHALLLDLHQRHETAQTLEGDARAAFVEELNADMQAFHEQHEALWQSLDPEVREALAARFHEQMHGDDDSTVGLLHERMRRMHGSDHGMDDAGS